MKLHSGCHLEGAVELVRAGPGALGSIKFETWLKYPCLKLQRKQWLADRWMGGHKGMTGNGQGKGAGKQAEKELRGGASLSTLLCGGLLGHGRK